jgi:pentafunctional AROM polypeptide
MLDNEGSPEMVNYEAIRNECKYDLYLSGIGENNILTDSFAAAGQRLFKLIERIRSPAPTAQDTLLDAGEWSHFVSLTFPSVDEALPALPFLRVGADAFELRVDLLDDISVMSLHRQMALLRDSSPLPIVFTVRSDGQIGKFPSDPKRIFTLLREGLRAGAEWVDVEACWPTDQVNAFTALAINNYATTSRLLGSLHVTTPQSRDQVDKIFSDCSLSGRAHVLKAVTGAANNEDCELIHTAGAAASARTNTPYIGVCLGAAGCLSRVLNRVFTPVTHSMMAAAAPGQLTVEQLMEARLRDGLIVPKEYFLFGTPIQQSLSPAMHNGAFNALLMAHKYGLNEQQEATDYIKHMAESSFGGASVTIPHKETIISLLDEVRGAACSIGAINTVVPESIMDADGKMVRKLVGMNTDWLGMKRPLLRQLRSRGIPWSNEDGDNVLADSGGSRKRSIGLVVGAGGTARAACYAIKDLGLDLIVYNRTPEKGEEVAKMFGGKSVTLEELGKLDPSTLQVVISTLPGQAGFTLPTDLLQGSTPPVILDAVYKPARTKLIEQAIEHNCLFVQGATMLLEQGMEQFEIWHKRRAPREEMDAAVFNGVERLA